MATFGTTTIGPTLSPNQGQNTKIVARFTLSEAGYVYSISRHLRSISNAQATRAIIYNTSAGLPSTLAGVTEQNIYGPGLTDGWQEQMFPVEILLSAGDYYLGQWFGAASGSIRLTGDSSGTRTIRFNNNTYSATANPSDPFGASSSDVGDPSIYASYAPVTSTPINFVDPVIYGTHTVGAILTVEKGRWAGNITGYTYQWKRDGLNISGATSTSYTVVSADAAATITCAVTATNANGTTTEATFGLQPDQEYWSPLYRPDNALDTIWLFDSDAESAATWDPRDNGSLIDHRGANDATITRSNPWRVGSGYTITAGPFGRNGITGNATAGAFVLTPGPAVPAQQFTVEFHVKSSANWTSDVGDILVLLGDLPFGGGSSGISIGVGTGGVLEMIVENHQVVPSVTRTYTDTRAILAGEWVGVAATYNGTTMTLFRAIDGVVTTVAAQTVGAPFAWSSSDGSGSLAFPYGSAGGGGASNWVISDLRISRLCRTPDELIEPTEANTVAITDTTTGTLNPYLRGGVHYPARSNTVTTALAAANMAIARTDKFMSACPIKAGAPDATRPTLGHSGSYSYNFAPLDHTLDHYANMGLVPYLDFYSTPQILGGSNAPYTVAQCADPNALVGSAAENQEVPLDLSAFATIAADFVYHVHFERGETVAGWAIWNEPDLVWPGTVAQFNSMYAQTMNAVRAVDPDANVGGPELSDPISNLSAWVTGSNGLIKYCADNDTPLDFISFHMYSGDTGLAKKTKTSINTAATTYSLGYNPDIWVTEWSWNGLLYQGAGKQPYRSANWLINDWAASLYAAHLVAAHNWGVSGMIYYSLSAGASTATGINASVLYSSTQPWVGLNVMEMFRRLQEASTLTISSQDLENGVNVLSTKTSDGIVRVLAVNHKYRMHRTTDIDITLPASVANATTATQYLIDATHSNYYDDPTDAGTLESQTIAVNNGTISLTMQPRSVHLLEIATFEPNRPKRRRVKKLNPHGRA